MTTPATQNLSIVKQYFKDKSLTKFKQHTHIHTDAQNKALNL